MHIIIKLLFLASFVIAENNYHRCGLTPANSSIRINRPPSDTSVEIGHFRIHYYIDGIHIPKQGSGDNAHPYPDNNNNGHPDYVDEVGEAANYSYNFMLNNLGYQNVVSDCDEDIQDVTNSDHCINFGGDSLYDIYIENLVATEYTVEYGWNYSSGEIEGASFIIIDNGFTEEDDNGEPLYYTTGLDAMRTTIAHEFFHAVQRQYHDFDGNNQYFYEMSSAWIEDIIYPDINDYISDGWTDNFYKHDPDLDDEIEPGYSIDMTTTNGYSIALYAHYLTSVVHNNSIIKEIWEEFSTDSNPLSCISNILGIYGTNFIDTWHNFYLRNFFNGYYPDMNNDFYYHPDQAIALPITMPNSSNIFYYDEFYHEVSINNLFVGSNPNGGNDPRIFRLIRFDIGEAITFGINITNLNPAIIANAILIAEENNINNHKILDLHDNIDEQYNRIKEVYFILRSNSTNNTSFDISFCDEQISGDITQDYIVNVLDYIKLVDHILDIELIEDSSCDLNQSGQCDIADTVLLIDIIIGTP